MTSLYLMPVCLTLDLKMENDGQITLLGSNSGSEIYYLSDLRQVI